MSVATLPGNEELRRRTLGHGKEQSRDSFHTPGVASTLPNTGEDGPRPNFASPEWETKDGPDAVHAQKNTGKPEVFASPSFPQSNLQNGTEAQNIKSLDHATGESGNHSTAAEANNAAGVDTVPTRASPLDSPSSPAPRPNSITSMPHSVPTLDQKQIKSLEKVLQNEEKTDSGRIKSAITAAGSMNKVERKAAKMEARAKKTFDAAMKKEYKYNKSLMKAQAAHQKAVIDLEEAKKVYELKASHHHECLTERDNALKLVDRVQQEKATHDVERAERRATSLENGGLDAQIDPQPTPSRFSCF